MIELKTEISHISGVGKILAQRLEKLGIKKAEDLLFYFPARYNDFSKIIPIKQAYKKLREIVCIKGKILEIKNTKTKRKKFFLTTALIQDSNDFIKAIWFNQPYLTKNLNKNDTVCLAGKISLFKDGIFLNNPVYEKIKEKKSLTHTGRIVPIYPETKGITSRWLRTIIKFLLTKLVKQVPEILPPIVLTKFNFPPIKKALWQVHFPSSLPEAQIAKKRFSFQELFLIQLNVLREKMRLAQKKAIPCPILIDLMKEFTNSLPFKLTDAQKKCAFQILKDLEKNIPMSRLLEGDVGSGKTVVATMAALNVVKNGNQVAFMAPTEILARQHFESLSKLLLNFGVKIGLLTSKETKIFKDKEILKVSKKSLLGDIENQQVDIIIGTHSLIQKGVEFKKLALVIFDEQHRFGVEQRAKLVKGAENIPHLLSMTATPIPRTLALTIYGDLDISLLNEMPKNRKKVKTIIVPPEKRNKAYEFIREEVKKGRGVFVICPKIESKNQKELTNFPLNSKEELQSLEQAPLIYDPKYLQKLEVKAVKEEYEKLSKEIFPDLKIGMLHGKMKAQEKEKIMTNFREGKIDILVSTSVVEVGVDVPRASIIMIEGAERFGLAQLHQFRGRVGRSEIQSYCFLFTTSPDQMNRERLRAFIKCENGFELAQKDLEIRGPGTLFGTQQWGVPDIAMEGISNIFLVEKSRELAKEILEKDPQLQSYPLLLEKLKTLENKIHFE